MKNRDWLGEVSSVCDYLLLAMLINGLISRLSSRLISFLHEEEEMSLEKSLYVIHQFFPIDQLASRLLPEKEPGYEANWSIGFLKEVIFY